MPNRVESCIFCAIAAGDATAEIVDATDLALAFRDLRPVAETHVLVIPRRHLEDAAAVTAEHGPLLAEMLGLARAVAARDGIIERGYRLVMNVGRDSGNSVGHLHLHVIGGRALGALG